MKGNFAIVIQIRLVKRRMISLSNSFNAFSWKSKNSLFLSHRSHRMCMCVCVSECIGWSGPLCILQSDLLPLGLPGLAYNCPPLQIVTSLPCPSPLLFFPLFILSDFRLLWVIIHQWGPPAPEDPTGRPLILCLHNQRPFLMEAHYTGEQESMKMQHEAGGERRWLLYPDNHFKQIIMIINQSSHLRRLASGLHDAPPDL